LHLFLPMMATNALDRGTMVRAKAALIR